MSGLAGRLWTAAFAARVRLVKPAFDPAARASAAARPSPPRRAAGRALAAAARILPFPPAEGLGPPVSGAPPRRIWMLWHDGEAAAPPLVRACIESWRRLNPGWEVVVLDHAAACGLVDLSHMPPDAGLSHHADMLRVDLLAREGGVWADATCLCARPLDAWLPARMTEGVFAFARPAPDRPAASWFLAARPGAPLMAAWARAARDCWAIRGRTDHYFALHYLFEWLLLADRRLAASWAAVPSLPAGPAHRLQAWLKGDGSDPALRARAAAALADPETPVHKLDWRIEDGGARLARALAELGSTSAADGAF